MSLWTKIYKYIFKTLLSVIWMYIQKWDCWIIVIKFLIFWGTTLSFFIVGAPFYNRQCRRVPGSPHSHQQLFSSSSSSTHPSSFPFTSPSLSSSFFFSFGYEVVSHYVLICLFLMISEHRFMCFISPVFGETSVQFFCTFFNQVVSFEF